MGMGADAGFLNDGVVPSADYDRVCPSALLPRAPTSTGFLSGISTDSLDVNKGISDFRSTQSRPPQPEGRRR